MLVPEHPRLKAVSCSPVSPPAILSCFPGCLPVCRPTCLSTYPLIFSTKSLVVCCSPFPASANRVLFNGEVCRGSHCTQLFWGEEVGGISRTRGFMWSLIKFTSRALFQELQLAVLKSVWERHVQSVAETKSWTTSGQKLHQREISQT